MNIKIGDLSLEAALSQHINNMGVTIFLDGLDELHYQIRETVFYELKQLLSTIDNSKLIITSRYFEDVDSFKNIDKNEILPLSDNESLKITEQWIDDSAVFWRKLNEKPYGELATRPLFLFYLVMLYKANKGILPEQGVDVYRQVVLLVLREWDDQKEYKAFRFSKIKNFDTYKKEEFLSHITFYLTYELGVKRVFSRSDLSQTYYSIHKKYPQLKASDADTVIKDIETDNGLIITSYENEYEFSHLSLQEYLCAKYILSVPFTRKIYDYMKENPEPLALSVALSPEPANWFSTLILNNINEPQYDRKLTSPILYTFINRLISEGAIFSEVSLEFGLSILSVIFSGSSSPQVCSSIERFLQKNPVALDSIRRAAKKFKVSNRNSIKEEVEITINSIIHSDLFIAFPEKGIVPLRIWKNIK